MLAVVEAQLVLGRAVASNTRDPRFESQQWQNFIYQLYIKKEKTKIKIRGREWPIFKKAPKPMLSLRGGAAGSVDKCNEIGPLGNNVY